MGEFLAEDLPLGVIELGLALVLADAAGDDDLGVDGELLRDQGWLNQTHCIMPLESPMRRLGGAEAKAHHTLAGAPDAGAHRLLAAELELRDGHGSP